MNKKNIATEIKLFQKIAAISLGIGFVVYIVCLLVFNPWKFDGEKYRQIKGTSYSSLSSDINAVVYSPAWWAEGFFDYCDGEVRFTPDFPQVSYNDRKEYLLSKAFRYALWSAILSLFVVFGYRYIKKGQTWVNENAK